MIRGTVGGIHIFPIKSCRGVSLDSVAVTSIGLAGDRIWQVIDGDGRGVTQRQHRVLATVQPLPSEQGGLHLTAAAMSGIEVAPLGELDSVALSHFGIPVVVADAGDEAAEWFSQLLGGSHRLVSMQPESGWRLPEDLDVFGQNAAFTDAAPLLVVSESSHRWLADRATEEFGIERFRANLVVQGSDPWEEDTWVEANVGEATLTVVSPWPRCAIPQIDQLTSERHKEPAKVLRAHRWCTSASEIGGRFGDIVAGNSLFGVACSVRPGGARMHLGDAVNVPATRAPILAMPA